MNTGPRSAARASSGGVFQQKVGATDTAVDGLAADELALDAELARERARPGLPGQIVIVATLLEKVPNIAGLCRTGEIFAADELVVADAALVASRDFQAVCMTADKWVTISEVDDFGLAEYLEGRRHEGYTVIALEQSSRSVALQDYRFPDRVCLLLGNEREGVRADLLHLCDVCLEIPQFGVIRSLNVHVAGSLVLWEMRRQQLVSGPK